MLPLYLSDLTRRLLGIRPEIGAQIEHARLYFAGGWPTWGVILVVCLGALWFGWLYVRDGSHPPLWVKGLLLLLRLTALAALLFMLMQPMLRLTRSERQRTGVVLLVDTSQSMGFRDPRLPASRAARLAKAAGISPTRATRAEIAQRLLQGPQGDILRDLTERYHLRLYTFNSETTPVTLPPASQTKPPSGRAETTALRIAPDQKRGSSTQIGSALKRVLDDVEGQTVAGVLLLSDGGNNLGEDPLLLAERAKEQSVPISAIGIGDPTPTRDLMITDVLADQIVRKDNIVQVFAGVSHRGYEGKTITLLLKRGNETVSTQTLRLGPASRKQTVAFVYTPKQVGSFTWTVSTAVLPDEVEKNNNRRLFLQQVISRRLKVLYVEGEPRWEYRYLKNAILRDKQIQFGCLLAVPNAPPGGEGNVPLFGFPPDEKSLFEYDILILGDVPRSYFSETQLRNIRRFVEDKGASLIVIAGEKHMPQEYRDSPLAAVFPVVLTPLPESVKTIEPVAWELTAEGRQEPMLRMADDPVESARIWRRLPGMYWHAGALRAKPGARVLAVNPARSNAYGKRVALAMQSFGAGRCLMSMTDSTWRWRYRVGDRYFYRYWGQAIRAMTPQETPGGNRFAQVTVDRAQYLLGDRVSVHARLLDAFYRPVKARQVTAALQGEVGGARTVLLNAVPGSPGLYAADLLADRLGKFRLSLASPARPDARATTTFLVQSVSLESQQPELNEGLLRRIATTSGGRYYQPDEIRQWLNSLQKKDLILRSQVEVELWDSPLLLLLFICPLTLEWLARKKIGLL